MKRKFQLPLVAIIILATSMTSCTKDAVETKNDTPASVAADFTAIGTGSISGRVSPAGYVTITLTNRSFFNGPFAADKQTGVFNIGDIPQGDYKMVVTYASTDPNDPSATRSFTTQVSVRANVVTELGVLSF